jgi:hypothetical protein
MRTERGRAIHGKQINGKWYHFDESGYMQTGWILDNGKWYYLDGSGAMVTGYFHAPDGYWYYFRADGSMAVGDVTVDGKQRHFNDQLPPKPTYDKDPDTGIWVPEREHGSAIRSGNRMKIATAQRSAANIYFQVVIR